MAKTDNNAQKFTNFEEMFSKTKNVAETINKKSAMYLELSRKRIEYMDAKSKLAKAYEKFGRLQYETYLGNDVDENDYACAVADISALKEKTQSLEAELEEAKNKDAEELKRGAEEFKNEVKSASKEARDVILQQAKDFFRAVQLSVKAGASYEPGCEITTDFTEVKDDKENSEKDDKAE
uniref:hypothetical protein n=1 Tax=Eubacterium sp. TaxID=142586 RepID=UPI0040277EF8